MSNASSSDIKLSDEIDHKDNFPGGEDYWHETLWTFTAESEGMDILLQTRMNTVRTKNPDGQWFHVGETLEHETTLVMVPSSRRGKGMEDHDFIHTGHYLAQRHELSDLSITRTEEAVTWKAHGRTYVSRPPVWELKGAHGGVELDLVCRQMPPAIWVLGHYEEAMRRNTGGYDAPAEFEGTIKVDGKTYPINKGYGIRENMGVGRNTNIIGNLPPPDRMYWDYLVSPDVMVYLFLYPKPGIRRGIVRAFGEEFLYGSNNGLGADQGSINHTILEHWNDPRSGLALASKWHLSMASNQGVLDLQITAHGRSYFYWMMKNGVRVEIWQIGTANGTFTLPDGRCITLKDRLMCIDPLYTVGRAEETIKVGCQRSHGCIPGYPKDASPRTNRTVCDDTIAQSLGGAK